MNIQRLRRDLASLPVIRAQVPTLDRPLRGEVNGNSQPTGANMHSRPMVVISKRSMHTRRVDPARFSDAGGRVASRYLDPHVLHGRSFSEKSKRVSHKNRDIVKHANSVDAIGVPRPRKPRADDPWKQRDRFIELADADAAELMAQGMTEDEAYQSVAVAIGLKTGASLIKAYRHDRKRKPKRPTVELAAKRWGVPESELYGDLPGSDLTPAKRLAKQSVTKYLADPNTSDEDAEKVFNALQELIEAGKVPKPR